MRKKIFIIFTFLFAANSLYSQNDFKEVKTAQDVIDNYISAVGGADKIKSVRSETVTGTFMVEDFAGSFITYKNDTIFATRADQNVDGKDMMIMMSLTTKNYAWDYQMGAPRDFTGEELETKAEDIITGSIGFYLNYKKYGYGAELKGVDSINGAECYKVVISKSTKELKTNYYDRKTFYLLKSEKPDGMILEYGNFKKVKGIIRPFKIIQHSHAEIDEMVSEYKFNEPVDPALLVKPTNK